MTFNPRKCWHECGCGILFLAVPGKQWRARHPTHNGKAVCKQEDVTIVSRKLTPDELRNNREELDLRFAVFESRQETRKENKSRREVKNWDGVRAKSIHVVRGGQPGSSRRH